MYLALTSEGVGKVKQGDITAMYKPTATLEDVYNGTAEEISSEKIDERVKSKELVQLTHRPDEFRVQDTIGSDQSKNLPQSAQISQLKNRATKELLL